MFLTKAVRFLTRANFVLQNSACASQSNIQFSLTNFRKYSKNATEELEQVEEKIAHSEEPKEPQEISKKKEINAKSPQREIEDNFAPYRFIYPEFLPDPDITKRNKIRERLERQDMIKRRGNIEIPEFYVGSILSVTVSDLYAPNKSNTFVGICTERIGCGLRASFILRNHIDGQGVEILYEMYNPTIQAINVLRLERRLDENLRYLRDALPEYSTIPFDMVPELRSAGTPVPVNPIKVRMKPRPWCCKWQIKECKGIADDFDEILKPWEKKRRADYIFIQGDESKNYDMMKQYRQVIPVEEQTEIFSEVHPQLANLTQTLRLQKRKRAFSKPTKLG